MSTTSDHALDTSTLHGLKGTNDFVSNVKGVVLYLAENVCSLFSLPVELLIRIRIGRRYFSVPGAYVCTVLPALLHDLYVATVGMVQTAASLTPLSIAAPVWSGPWLLRWYLAIAFLAALAHKVATWRAAASHRETVTTYGGDSLPPLVAVTGWVLARFPGNQAYLTHEVTRRATEPLAVYLASVVVAQHLSTLLGWWLGVAAYALFFRSAIQFTLIRDKALDSYDAVIEVKAVAEAMRRMQSGEMPGQSRGVFAYAAVAPPSPPERPLAPAGPAHDRPLSADELLARRTEAGGESAAPADHTPLTAAELLARRRAS